jgi:hypothetical protein
MAKEETEMPNRGPEIARCLYQLPGRSLPWSVAMWKSQWRTRKEFTTSSFSSGSLCLLAMQYSLPGIVLIGAVRKIEGMVCI